MEKSFRNFFLMLMALSGTYTASAQSKAIQVSSSSVEFYKQLKFSDNPIISVPAYGITIDLPQCDVHIKNDISKISGSTTRPSNLSIVPNLDTYDYGYISPERANYMDLGSPEKYFRFSYTYQPYHKLTSRQFSDARYKENIKELGNASEIIRQLHPVSFDFIRTDTLEDTAGLKDKAGFLAQEMLEVLPHLVGQLPGTDLYVVDYTSVIPYLVKAVQETQEEKSELEDQVSELQTQLVSLQEIVQRLLVQNGATPPAPDKAPKNGPKNTVKAARLFQNLPNPFSESTIIRYELPKAAGNAYIQVFDMGGRMVENIQLSRTQEVGQVELSAGELLPGTYTYSLIVSGKVIDSKRMVVTE